MRIGRLLIPYLSRGGYTGIEPNEWLFNHGIESDTGKDQINLKQPRLLIGDSCDLLEENERFDFAFAQSIFSHTGYDLFQKWLSGLSSKLAPNGMVLFTYIPGSVDSSDDGWIYPGCVTYRWATIQSLCRSANLIAAPIAWAHPRQSWVVAVPTAGSLPNVAPNWTQAVRSAYPSSQPFSLP